MSYSITPNLGLKKPTPGADDDQWGTHWNDNAMILDMAFGSASVVNVLDHGAAGDGVTDDTAAIQSVLNTYAGKAVVFIPNSGGPYLIRGLLAPSDLDLLLQGTLRGISPGLGYMVNILTKQNVTIRGQGTIDCNHVTSGPFAVQVGVGADNSSNIHISGITIKNAAAWNFSTTGSSHIRVDGVSLLDGNNANQFANGCDDCWITNSLVHGPDADGGFAFYGGVTNSGAKGNTVRNAGIAGGSGQHGIQLLADGSPGDPQAVGCSNILIADNIIYNNGAAAVWCDVHVGAFHKQITIASNVCYGNCQIGGEDAAIHVGNSENVTIIGNHVTRNKGYIGISVLGNPGGGLGGTTICGNHITSSAYGSTGGVGVYVDTAPNLLVSGNNCFNPTGSMTAGIGGTAGAANAYLGNFFSGLPLTVTLQSDTLTANAMGGNLYSFGSRTVLQTTPPQQITNVAGAPRWYMGRDGATESGGDTGSNFAITSVKDDGTPLPSSIVVSRASGKVTVRTLNASNLPTSATGLTAGDVWRNGTVLNIV